MNRIVPSWIATGPNQQHPILYIDFVLIVLCSLVTVWLHSDRAKSQPKLCV